MIGIDNGLTRTNKLVENIGALMCTHLFTDSMRFRIGNVLFYQTSVYGPEFAINRVALFASDLEALVLLQT